QPFWCTPAGSSGGAMTLQVDRSTPPPTGGRWYATSAVEVATALDVDPAVGLSSSSAAERLRDGGANALPEERERPGWRRFGDQVAADGRIVAANALQIDESALTGESTPSAKDAAVLADVELGPGDQSDMAFMNTPVTHGSGVVVITGTGGDTELGKISALLT